MRLLVWLAVGTGSALLAGTASADLLPPPPPLPPAPTVTVPALPLPPPPVTTTTVTTTPVVAQAVSSVTATAALSPTSSGGSAPAAVSSVTSATAQTAPSSLPSSSSSTATTADARSNGGPRAEHFHSSRSWIGTTGPRQRRTTTFTFVLRQAGRVVFTVNQVSPACVEIGHFTAAGRAGLNRVRFGGAVHGRRLTAGTYRISIRTTAGHVVRRVTLVVVDGGAPSRDELRTLKSANACSSGSGGGTTRPSRTQQAPLAENGPRMPVSQQGAAQAVVPPAPRLHGILGSSIERTSPAVRPLLVALLAVAVVLLGVASLPRAAVPDPRMHDLLARHRVEVAGLGVAALLAVALALLLA